LSNDVEMTVNGKGAGTQYEPNIPNTAVTNPNQNVTIHTLTPGLMNWGVHMSGVQMKSVNKTAVTTATAAIRPTYTSWVGRKFMLVFWYQTGKEWDGGVVVVMVVVVWGW
jgi:hypothetical protein